MPSIDLHTHVLPGVDDGPEDLDGSLELARTAVLTGTVELVATPHVNERRFIAPREVAPAVAALQAQLDAEGIGLRLHAGAEIALGRLVDLDEDDLHAARLGSGSALLLECPFAVAAGDFEPLIRGAQDRGHTVLLAHPERCPTFQRAPERLARLVDSGALVQITADSLRGMFGTRVRDFAFRLLGDDLVHVVASDAHSAGRRPPGIEDAVAQAEREVPGVTERTAWLTEEVPAALLAGEPVPDPPPLAAPRRAGWRRALRAVSSAR